MSSLSKDKKLTGLVVIFIEKGSAKSACNLNEKMDKLQLNKIFRMAGVRLRIFSVGLLSFIINSSYIKHSTFPRQADSIRAKLII